MVRWLAVALVACTTDPQDPKDPLGSLPTDHPPTGPTTPSTPTCDPAEPPSYAVPADPTCGLPAVGTFEPVVEWTWSANPLQPGFHEVMTMPAVARLDADPVPDIVFVAFQGSAYGQGGALTAISGADGATRWSVVDPGGAHPRGSGGVAIGDLDGDGRPEIVVPAIEGLLCVDADGAFVWLAPVEVDASAMPAIGDLEGDGYAEVVVGRTVFDHDGTVRWTGTEGQGGGLHPASFPVDLDGDGFQEIIAGNTVYERDGAVRWVDGGGDGKAAVADFDGDGVPELAVGTGAGELRLVGADGGLRWSFEHGDSGGGAPTVADFDGDGAPEIGVANTASYQVVDGDGTLLWSAPTRDRSGGLTAASVFDFDRDGALEVVYADEETLWVFDGATGAVELQWEDHSSGTLHEYPVIADVDGDGSADVVVASNDYAWPGSTGITVIGDANRSWAPARPVWNQHAYSITNVDDDGGIPATPAPSWASFNSFRAANVEPTAPEADLAAGEPWACLDECASDRAILWLPVENRGGATSGPVTVTVTGSAGLVASLAVPAIAAGGMAWAGPVPVTSADYGLTIEVGSDAADCDATDDGWVSPSFPCE